MDRNVEARLLGPKWGSLVETRGGDLVQLDRNETLARFLEAGVVLLRGFNADVRMFDAFGQSLFGDFMVHPNRRREKVSDDRTTVLVDPDFTAIAAHQELGYFPVRPEVLWFHCIQPAKKGGETTVV